MCLCFRFGFAREKFVNYCQKMFTCFPSHPDRGRLGVEMWWKLVNSVSPNPRFASSTKMKTGFKLVQKSRIKQFDKMKFENVCKTFLPRCMQGSSIHFYLICLLLSHISLHIFVMHWIVEAARLPPNSDPDAQTGLQVSRHWIKIGSQGGRIYVGFLEVINPSSGCLRGQILNLASQADQT